MWAAQRAIYGESPRRPYVVSGVYPQRLRTSREDVPRYIRMQLREGLAVWSRRLDRAGADEGLMKRISTLKAWFERELKAFEERFPP